MKELGHALIAWGAFGAGIAGVLIGLLMMFFNLLLIQEASAAGQLLPASGLVLVDNCLNVALIVASGWMASIGFSIRDRLRRIR
jgi:hypothetical protein